MIEQELQIRTADGAAEAVLFHPEDTARPPGVLYLTDAGGIRPACRDNARRLASQGYAVLMPNLFYRTSKLPVFDFKPTMGEERTTKRFAELSAPLTPQAMERDAAAYVGFLASHESVSKGPIGVVGYCLTGAMALRAAAVRPDKIAAAASTPTTPPAHIWSCRE